MNTSTLELQVCDLSYLEQFAQGNAAFIQEMLKIYLEEINIDLNHLESAIEHVDFPSIQHFAHHMRSTLPFSGIDKLIGKDIEQIELLGKQAIDLSKIQFLFEKSKAICLLANDELQPMINR